MRGEGGKVTRSSAEAESCCTGAAGPASTDSPSPPPLPPTSGGACSAAAAAARRSCASRAEMLSKARSEAPRAAAARLIMGCGFRVWGLDISSSAPDHGLWV